VHAPGIAFLPISQSAGARFRPAHKHLMALLCIGRPQQRIANGNFASRHDLGIDTHIGVVERMVESSDESRSRSAVAGLTWVAAHRVIGEITRNRAAPMAISESIQSCSLQADGPSKYIFARNRIGSIETPIVAWSASRRARLISETY
jgi:hypothetical protein